jgi:hypothetical protein
MDIELRRLELENEKLALEVEEKRKQLQNS